MTDREKQILDILKDNPLISQEELALKLGIKRGSIASHISNLTKKGIILGKGYIISEEDYVVVIGGSNVDITGFPNQKLKNKDSNPGQIKNSNGGVGRNIAENISRLGVNTKLISAVGDDEFGRKLLEDAEKNGINVDNVIKSKKYSTSIYLCVIDESGDMNVAIADMDVIKEITVQYIQQNDQLISKAKSIIVDANINSETIDYILEKYKKTPIFVDTVSTAKSVKFKSNLAMINTIKPNIYEARTLLDIVDKNISIDKMLIRFKNLGIENPIISDGSKGAYYLKDGKVKHFKSLSNNPINTTGAGDAFMAGLVYSHFKNRNIDETIMIASECSKLAVESEDTINISLTEDKVLKSILDNRI